MKPDRKHPLITQLGIQPSPDPRKRRAPLDLNTVAAPGVRGKGPGFRLWKNCGVRTADSWKKHGERNRIYLRKYNFHKTLITCRRLLEGDYPLRLNASSWAAHKLRVAIAKRIFQECGIPIPPPPTESQRRKFKKKWRDHMAKGLWWPGKKDWYNLP